MVERKGEHVGRLDVKHGGITIVGNLARAVGGGAGVTGEGDARRGCDGAEAAGTLDGDVGGELSEAFRFLWEVRLRHQVGQVRAGVPPDDFVDPATLGPADARAG